LNKKDFADPFHHGFEEIIELAGSCRFSDCTHINEDGCAVVQGISEGILSEESLHHYHREKNEADYVSKQKNKTKAIDYMKQRKLFKP
jgi:ribosome biogenesis GTPase